MHPRKIDDSVLLEMLNQGKNQKEVAAHFRVSRAAVCKRLKRLSSPSLESVLEKHGLSEKQGKFAIAKAQGMTATQAALASYEAGSVESAKAIGSQLMKQPEIRTAIQEIMDLEGLTRTYRVKKLKAFIENRDPSVGVRALDISLKLGDDYPPVRSINLNTSIKLTSEEAARFETKYGRGARD